MIIYKKYTFDAAHKLTKVKVGHPCSFLHGHTYNVIIYVEGGIDERGFVLDFHEMDDIIKPMIEKLDHSYLNDFFDNPTSENITCWFVDSLKTKLPIYKIEVKETPKTGCIWEKNGETL